MSETKPEAIVAAAAAVAEAVQPQAGELGNIDQEEAKTEPKKEENKEEIKEEKMVVESPTVTETTPVQAEAVAEAGEVLAKAQEEAQKETKGKAKEETIEATDEPKQAILGSVLPVAPAPAPALAPAPASAVPAAVPAATVEDEVDDVPDPDEDDLDDLDNFLDDFSAAQIDSKAPAVPAVPGATNPLPAPGTIPGFPGLGGDIDDENLEDMLNDEDFAKQLQAGMADLLGEFDKSPDVQAQFESLLKEFGMPPPDGSGGGDMAAAAAAAAATSSTPKATSAAPAASAASAASAPPKTPKAAAAPAQSEASFEETIRRTMERMKASGDQATAAAAADTESTDDMLSEFLKQMQSGAMGGAGSEEELSKMLVGMMEELTNKEILYEPMKELHDKFPAWMDANRDKTPADDLKRYQEQQSLVREIVTRFETPSYSDTNPEDREYIVDRMQRMQSAGSPPADLVGDMPSAQEALAVPDESCNTQ